MNESRLTELLERAGEQTDVGPPPLNALRVGAARRRRRRTVGWLAVSAAAVVAVVGATTLLVSQGRGSGDPPAPAGTSEAPPVAIRLVGLGHAAIAVPKAWGTNQLGCGTPQKDTVIVDVGPVDLCLMPRPAGVESVEVDRGKPLHFGFHADETIEIGGLRAERQHTSCTDGAIRVTVCSGTVVIPSLDVSFRAESSTSAAEVDRLLARIVIVPDHVGVPGFRSVDRAGHQPLGAEYADTLRQAGLKPNLQSRKAPGYPAGTIFTASPAPGTMLAPGATVTVTVAAR